MALPASDVWLRDRSLALLAVRIDLYLLAKEFQDGSCNVRSQTDKLTGIRTPDARDRTVLAKGRIPCKPRRIQEAAFLTVAPAQIVAVKIFTFRAVGCSHADW